MILNTNHPTLTTSKDVKEIANSLKKLGITYFDYTRNYSDGGRIWLTNHISSTQRYLEKKYYLQGNMDGEPKIYKSQIVFLDTLPKQHIYDDVLRSHNIDHGIQIINSQKNYCEFFGFATTKGNTGIINTYLTKLDYLKQFCNVFTEQAALIIKIVEENKIFLPYHKESLDFLKNNAFEDNIPNFYKMSKRQLECAKLLIIGKSIREIAACLDLSPRTVEHYINHIKVKLKCKNKSELIIKLLKIIGNV